MIDKIYFPEPLPINPGQKPAQPQPAKQGGAQPPAFAKILDGKMPAQGVKFSQHAQERLRARGISLNEADMDISGTVVRTLNLGNTRAGDGTILWDGRNGNGSTLPAGQYSFSVTGYNAKGEKFQGNPLLVGTVEGITLEGKEPNVTIGGISVPLSNVLSVKGA
ncbi:FlgD immunoglobulin-like domain containing protein [Geobacter grbiciae]|uniref:FlgD immunoglobulin-like domain containing protein n=1 Tax=Geobacter grbiciae TaxID=155042 RepID=UPI001FE841FA|nr:FlgD immunoglobulin-like domain containing protein [Geobacter grbiciae]